MIRHQSNVYPRRECGRFSLASGGLEASALAPSPPASYATAVPPRILILCRGHLGSHVSSPGIRATAQAYVLATQIPGAQVTLAGAS